MEDWKKAVVLEFARKNRPSTVAGIQILLDADLEALLFPDLVFDAAFEAGNAHREKFSSVIGEAPPDQTVPKKLSTG